MLRIMNEFAPEEMLTPEDERINALSEAFLAAGDPDVIDEELDDDPIEPMDV